MLSRNETQIGIPVNFPREKKKLTWVDGMAFAAAARRFPTVGLQPVFQVFEFKERNRVVEKEV